MVMTNEKNKPGKEHSDSQIESDHSADLNDAQKAQKAAKLNASHAGDNTADPHK